MSSGQRSPTHSWAAYPHPGDSEGGESRLRITARERVVAFHSSGWVPGFYVLCMLLTVFLIIWTVATDNIRHTWITVCEAVLTAAISVEIGIRVYTHPDAPCCKDRMLWGEAVLAVACVAAFLVAAIWPQQEGELADEIEDALLGVRYAAQTVRFLLFWCLHRRQKTHSGRVRLFHDFSRNASFLSPATDQEPVSSDTGPNAGELIEMTERVARASDAEFLSRVSASLLDQPVDAMESEEVPTDCSAQASPQRDRAATAPPRV
eukprot:TRINITY_DN67017_c0_g1_i1.p1 TRINITY_DN67017_c0_g1~~TRINITY_DN67017_c0_g1_i1.p1  ORF type:complete len:287 (+),score=90.00 TRINITY_DN67017_c0_g1_i1:73-861(+)